jgi:hypothetical protein
MTLKIEKIVSRKTAIVRLIGRLSVEHLEEVSKQIKLIEGIEPGEPRRSAFPECV